MKGEGRGEGRKEGEGRGGSDISKPGRMWKSEAATRTRGVGGRADGRRERDLFLFRLGCFRTKLVWLAPFSLSSADLMGGGREGVESFKNPCNILLVYCTAGLGEISIEKWMILVERRRNYVQYSSGSLTLSPASLKKTCPFSSQRFLTRLLATRVGGGMKRTEWKRLIPPPWGRPHLILVSPYLIHIFLFFYLRPVTAPTLCDSSTLCLLYPPLPSGT